MRLISCRIDNFGKLSDLQLEFSEGLNIFCEENGWGKSTLAAFLKAMFYGFDTKKESFIKDRELYRPWQGGVYGGEVCFAVNEKEYRIIRTFGKTEKTDTFQIFDNQTNLETTDYSSKLGIELFDLDASSFKRTVYIAQKDCQTESTDAINAKLGNLAENTNDMNNFELAIGKIKDKMNRMTPDRATGSIKKRKRSILELEEELRTFDSAEASGKILEAKIKEIQEQKTGFEEQRKIYAKALVTASEESRKEEQKKAYDLLLAEQKEKNEALKSFAEIFPNRVPQMEEFEKMHLVNRHLEEQKTTIRNLDHSDDEKTNYEKLAAVFSNGVPSDEELEEQIKELEMITKAKEEYNNLDSKMNYYEALALQQSGKNEVVQKKTPLLGMGIVLFIVGVVAAGFSYLFPAYINGYEMEMLYAGGAVTGLGILLIVIGAILKNSAKKKAEEEEEKLRLEAEKKEKPIRNLKDQLSQIRDLLTNKKNGVKAFLENYQIYCDESSYANKIYELKNQVLEYERLYQKRQKQRDAANSYQGRKDELDEFIRSMGLFVSEDEFDLNYFQTKAAEYYATYDAAQNVEKRREDFEKSCDVADLEVREKSQYTLDELNKNIMDIDTALEEIRDTMEQYHRQLEHLQEKIYFKELKEAELETERLLQIEEEAEYELLKTTQEYLSMAKDKFTSKYLAPISNGFQKYYELLTGDTSMDWLIDTNITVKKKECGAYRESQWLSAGYQDLFGTCLRLALVDAMYEKERPFLILDDPFVNLDDKKTMQGFELLNQIGKEYQTIYFTCHTPS